MLSEIALLSECITRPNYLAIFKPPRIDVGSIARGLPQLPVSPAMSKMTHRQKAALAGGLFDFIYLIFLLRPA
jgi:hypothetical protein